MGWGEIADLGGEWGAKRGGECHVAGCGEGGEEDSRVGRTVWWVELFDG